MMPRNIRALLLPPLALVCTLGMMLVFRQSLALCALLPGLWFFLFRPLSRREILLFIVAGFFITFQNYSVLRTGAFSFAIQDFLLMPYYEPLLWGFYFLNIKRFFGHDEGVGLEWRAVFGLACVSLAFGVFSGTAWHSAAVFTALAVLLSVFHSPQDLAYGAYALGLGFVVELFGVSTGAWSYPDPDFLGIPFWFAPMWISVGLLGRRLLFPLVAVLDRTIARLLG